MYNSKETEIEKLEDAALNLKQSFVIIDLYVIN